MSTPRRAPSKPRKKKQARPDPAAIEPEVRAALGETISEADVPAAAKAVMLMRTAQLTGVGWTATFRAGRVIHTPHFDLASVRYQLGGREGSSNKPWCPLVSVFVRERPVILSAEAHRILCQLAEPHLTELLRAIDQNLVSALRLLYPGHPPDDHPN